VKKLLVVVMCCMWVCAWSGGGHSENAAQDVGGRVAPKTGKPLVVFSIPGIASEDPDDVYWAEGVCMNGMIQVDALPQTRRSKQCTITTSADSNGSITPSGAVVVARGTSRTFAIAPDSCYHVANVLVDGDSVGAVSSYTFTNVTGSHTIAASFAINQYTIIASVGCPATIEPSGAVTVPCGGSQTFRITAASNWYIADVLVDGVSVGPGFNKFTNVTANHTITVLCTQ